MWARADLVKKPGPGTFASGSSVFGERHSECAFYFSNGSHDPLKPDLRADINSVRCRLAEHESFYQWCGWLGTEVIFGKQSPGMTG